MVQCISNAMLTHQNEGQKKVRQTSNRTPNLTFRSHIGTNNIQWTSNLKCHQPSPQLHILNSNKQTKLKMKNLDKMLVLNWHNQNSNITTVEMLKVFLQWLCSKAWEGEFSYPWQQCTCLCVGSLV